MIFTKKKMPEDLHSGALWHKLTIYNFQPINVSIYSQLYILKKKKSLKSRTFGIPD